MGIVSRLKGKNSDAPSLSSDMAEGYKELADNVLSLRARQPLQTLAVASSVPGEGASTIAASLALALAETGVGEILLVDCNFKSPSLARWLGVEDKPGLTDGVLAESDPAVFMIPSGFPCLTVMPSGKLRTDARPVLATDAFKTFLGEISHSFSLVLFDCAPINGSRDATIISSLVDALLLVVQAERTNYEVIAKAQERIASAGNNIIGVALNRRRYHIPEALYRRL